MTNEKQKNRPVSPASASIHRNSFYAETNWPNWREVLLDPVVRMMNIIRRANKDFLELVKKASPEAYVVSPSRENSSPKDLKRNSLLTPAQSVPHITPSPDPAASSVVAQCPRRTSGARDSLILTSLRDANEVHHLLDMKLVQYILEDLQRCINQVRFLPRHEQYKIETARKENKLKYRLSQEMSPKLAVFLKDLLGLNHKTSIKAYTKIPPDVGSSVPSITRMLGVYGMNELWTNEWRSDAVDRALHDFDSWNYDVFELNKVVAELPLTVVTYKAFDKRHLFSVFRIPPRTLTNFLVRLERTYFNAPFSCSLHAAQMVQNSHVVLGCARLSVTPLEALCVLLACSVHSAQHPGLTPTYLQQAGLSAPGALYRGAVLQNNSLHQWTTILKDRDCDILAGMSWPDRQRTMQMVKDLVLATDYAQYVNILIDMQSIAEKRVEYKPILNMDDDQYTVRLPRLCAVCMAVLMGYTALPLGLYLRWRDRQEAEYFNQGDCERARGFALSPMCDRHTVNFDRCQMGFFDIVVLPLWTALSRFCSPDNKPMMLHISENRHYLTYPTSKKIFEREILGVIHPDHEHGEHLPSIKLSESLDKWCPYDTRGRTGTSRTSNFRDQRSSIIGRHSWTWDRQRLLSGMNRGTDTTQTTVGDRRGTRSM